MSDAIIEEPSIESKVKGLDKNDRSVLLALYENFELVLPFKLIAKDSGKTVSMAKRGARRLARAGFAQVATGFDEEGIIRGGGYTITSEGIDAVNQFIILDKDYQKTRDTYNGQDAKSS